MFRISAAFAACLLCCAASADTRPDSHAPISVMGDHTHHKGELMLSYRYMHMSMQDNRKGTSDRSPEEIVTSETNVFGMPPTLRVVPTDMTMDMHMFGFMYAPSERVTFMGMVPYIEKEMEHLTFMGPAGTTRLGTFTTETSGLGDISVSALINLGHGPDDNWHITAGVSLPTGDIKERDTVLSPMGTTPELRLPYPMQLGSGTVDLIGGLTYARHSGAWGWGAQWRSKVRLGENDEDYALGNEHTVQGWLSYLVSNRVSLSARLAYFDRGNISGRDPAIAAPVQTADPHRQGIQRIDFGLGANVVLPAGHRLALEASVPVTEDLEGPQLETDWQLTVGWQYAP